jgi:hypothetical protein
MPIDLSNLTGDLGNLNSDLNSNLTGDNSENTDNLKTNKKTNKRFSIPFLHDNTFKVNKKDVSQYLDSTPSGSEVKKTIVADVKTNTQVLSVAANSETKTILKFPEDLSNSTFDSEGNVISDEANENVISSETIETSIVTTSDVDGTLSEDIFENDVALILEDGSYDVFDYSDYVATTTTSSSGGVSGSASFEGGVMDLDNFKIIIGFIIDNFEGGYWNPAYHGKSKPDHPAKTGVMQYSAETMFGIDRVAGGSINTGVAGTKFWALIDADKTPKKWYYNYQVTDNPTLAKQLKGLEAEMMLPGYKTYCSYWFDDTTLKLVNSDARLTLNFAYACWNGPYFFKVWAEQLTAKVKAGTTNLDDLAEYCIYIRENYDTTNEVTKTLMKMSAKSMTTAFQKIIAGDLGLKLNTVISGSTSSNSTASAPGSSITHGAEPVKPVQTEGAYVSSGFGSRTFGGKIQNHPGIDIHSDIQPAPIYSTRTGRIDYINTDISAGKNAAGGLGKCVMIFCTSNNMYSIYAHLDSVETSLKVGATVHAGERLGIMGTTGYSWGVHLHYEERTGMGVGGSVNPIEVVNLYS